MWRVPRSLKVCGRLFRLRDVPAIRGSCDDQTKPHPTISAPLRGDTIGDLTVMLHEVLHGGAWILDERVVDDIAEAQAELVWKCQWRKLDGVELEDS